MVPPIESKIFQKATKMSDTELPNPPRGMRWYIGRKDNLPEIRLQRKFLFFWYTPYGARKTFHTDWDMRRAAGKILSEWHWNHVGREENRRRMAREMDIEFPKGPVV